MILPKIEPNTAIETFIDEVNVLISEFNFLSTHVSLKANFDGQLIEKIEFSEGETKVIPHMLGKIPGGRFIIKQEGNGVLSDIPSGWNQYSIQMKNNGAETVTATLYLVRD